MKKLSTILTLALLMLGAAAGAQDLTASAQDIHFLGEDGDIQRGVRCATESLSDAERARVRADVQGWLDTNAHQSMGTTQIPVAFHVVYKQRRGVVEGDVPQSQVEDQIDVLNAAFAGTGFSFYLASLDYTKNNKWFNKCYSTNQERRMKQALAIDPAHNLNIYTCKPAGGILGYAYLPSTFPEDDYRHGTVLLYSSLPGGSAAPYNLGDTGTHEVGHYLGLEHTFNGGCAPANPPACYTSGDLICDTNSEAGPTFSPCFVGAKSTCGSVDPSDNYMNYSDDLCMEQFTPEQAKRLRCTLEHYRPNLYNIVGGYDHTVTPGQAGVLNTWKVTGATPGETNHFIYGTQPGSRPVPGCPGQTVGIGGLRILATPVADANGEATFSLFVPASLAGSTFLFQAVELTSCSVSQLLTVTF